MAKNADSNATQDGKDATSVTMRNARNLYQGVEREGFGMKMLASMGWEEGKGMGKNGAGITKHLHAKKRAQGTGIGADARSDASGKIDWTINAVSFDNILKGLNQAYTENGNDGGGGEEAEAAEVASEGGESDGEEDRKLTKKERKKKEKARKKAEEEEKKKKASRSAVGHAGRYSKRESQKRVKNYSAGDLDAILGGIGGFSAAPGTCAAEYARANEDDAEAEGGKKGDGDDSDDDDSDDDAPEKASDKSEKKKRKREAKEKAEQAKAITKAARAAKTIECPPPAKDWWGWQVGFVPAGHMGDNQEEDAEAGAERKRGFSEADQERLAMEAHDGANKGKRGLGVGTSCMSTLKNVAAGSSWEGKKMKFDEQGDAKKIKWGKLAVKMVTKAGGKMQLTDVLKKLTKKAKESERQGSDLEDEMRADLKSCSSLVVSDSAVFVK
jgi:Pin2-interacting protein X1